MAQMESIHFPGPGPGLREARGGTEGDFPVLGRCVVSGLKVTIHRQEALAQGRRFSWPRSCGAPRHRGSCPPTITPSLPQAGFSSYLKAGPWVLPPLCFLQGMGV